MNIKERVEQLRALMRKNGMYAYIIPSEDFHQSEYVGDYFKCRQFISGFTGSAGTVIITLDEAGLWTDGRYFIQANKQLEGSGLKLFKVREPGYPTCDEYLFENMKENSVLGFDGRVICAKEGILLENKLKEKNVTIDYSHDLIGEMWENRPEMSQAKAFLLDEKYAGVSAREKLQKVREEMKKENTNQYVLASLDDIAWLFNIRGRDVDYNPVILSYVVIGLEDVYFFTDKNKLNSEIVQVLEKENVKIKDYFEVYDFVKNIDEKDRVLLDENRVNYAIYNNIPKEAQKINKANVTTFMKGIKNEVELQNLRNCHIRDGVAFTKFMYWLKTNVSKMEITEISASDKLEQFRKDQKGFIELSFNTIAAYKEHAAMMHYSATEETDYKLEPEHFYLVDSGGQYEDGTTDITRTIVLGPIDDKLKLHFTAVAQGMMDLAMAKFLYGLPGVNLDVLARRPMWNLGIDYKCGTGHGVGFLLNVHEGPHSIRKEYNPTALEEGMVVTDEPGIYIEGSHGIRTENELIVKKDEKTESGQFMVFETLTCAPIDLDGINPDLLNKDQRNFLNNYHKFVYDNIAPHLNEEEKVWLKEYTRQI